MPIHLLSASLSVCPSFYFFFFNDTATTEIYTLSLHDALPIFNPIKARSISLCSVRHVGTNVGSLDRKSTRLNSSHTVISYAVFCLKKKNNTKAQIIIIQQTLDPIIKVTYKIRYHVHI